MAKASKKAPTASRSKTRGVVTDRKPTDWPPRKLCCCPPHAALWGSSSAECCPLSNKMLEDEHLQVRADANASVNPPGGPAVNADGSGGSELSTMLRKDVDLVAVTICYRFEWHAHGNCKPLAVRVQVFGDVEADMQCAPERGHTELMYRKIQTVDEVNNAPRGNATAVVTVLDCSGQRSECTLVLREP